MIRKANNKDIMQIVGKLKIYSKVLNVECAESVFSAKKASRMIHNSIQQGLVWVGVKDEEIVGILISSVTLNMWSYSAKEVYINAFWVDEEYRDTTLGGKMFLTFNKEFDKMASEDSNVKGCWFTIQTDTNMGEKSLKRLGFNLQELNFFKEK